MAFAYDPSMVLVTVNGFPITGKASDEFLTIEQNEDQATLMIGADGEGAVARSKNKSAKITIKVMATSAANDILNAAYQAWEAGGFVSVIFVKDLNGRSLHLAERAWPVKAPTVAYAAGVGEREWVFETDRLQTTMGGNVLAPTIPA